MTLTPKKRILVTGGLGYIGAHTAVALFEQGYQPVLVDNLSNTRIEVLDDLHQIIGEKPIYYNLDLALENQVKQLFEAEPNIAGVIHFAAFKAVGESVANPLKYYKNNLCSLIYLLEALNAHTIPLIFSSSCTVYGQADHLPVGEDAAVKVAESPYGNTKQVGEEIILDTVKAGSLKAIALRYFNPVGAHSSALIGELPLGVPQNLVPFITQTAIGIREQLSVFGSDYPTRDGTAIRDYIHVVDLAEAHIVALDRLLGGNNEASYEVFNLGTGNGNTVLEVLKTFEEVAGKPLNYKLAPRRPGDVIAAYADTAKASEVLGWKAKRSLADALSSAWKWEQALARRKS
jgi:UDP-glucose 4-epimerase